ncbi:unnamed protein product [Sympodiomycopsis kandeliae]
MPRVKQDPVSKEGQDFNQKPKRERAMSPHDEKDELEPETNNTTAATTTKSKKREPASMDAWKDAHWVKLNKAATRFCLENMTQIVKLDPDLAPWSPKGRIHGKYKQLMRSAQHGEEAMKQLDKEIAASKKKAKKEDPPQA